MGPDTGATGRDGTGPDTGGTGPDTGGTGWDAGRAGPHTEFAMSFDMTGAPGMASKNATQNAPRRRGRDRNSDREAPRRRDRGRNIDREAPRQRNIRKHNMTTKQGNKQYEILQ
mgnify:CR=1 FL=1